MTLTLWLVCEISNIAQNAEENWHEMNDLWQNKEDHEHS